MASLKERVNHALHSATGHHLTKGAPGAAAARSVSNDDLAALQRKLLSANEKLAEANGKLAATQKRLQQVQQQLSNTRQRLQTRERDDAERARLQAIDAAVNLQVPADVDPATHEILSAVSDGEHGDTFSLLAVVSAAHYVAANEIGGAVVDCDPGSRVAAKALARALVTDHDTSRPLYLVDSFSTGGDQADASAAVQTTGYPAERIHVLSGDARNTVWGEIPSAIGVLRVNVTDYRIADHELHELWDRVLPGGVVVIDGSDAAPHAQRVVDELLARVPERLLFVRSGSARIAVKPVM